MEQNEFIYWLKGFTEDKNTLTLSEMDIVKEKIEETLDFEINCDYNLGYFPNPFSSFGEVENNPYVYPGMAGIDKIKGLNLSKNKDQLVLDIETYAKDVDITNIIEGGVLVCDAYGEDNFLTWDEVDTFVTNRKKLGEETN